MSKITGTLSNLDVDIYGSGDPEVSSAYKSGKDALKRVSRSQLDTVRMLFSIYLTFYKSQIEKEVDPNKKTLMIQELDINERLLDTLLNSLKQNNLLDTTHLLYYTLGYVADFVNKRENQNT